MVVTSTPRFFRGSITSEASLSTKIFFQLILRVRISAYFTAITSAFLAIVAREYTLVLLFPLGQH